MDQSSRLVALLPFKRNSTRVPNKNFREMHSKPLYCWVLEALINSKLVDQIVIKQLQGVDSETYDKNILTAIYNDLDVTSQ